MSAFTLLCTFISISLFQFISYCSSARILALILFEGKSHFLASESLLIKLAEKGHEVDVVSFFPKVDPPPNYKDIPLTRIQGNVERVKLTDFPKVFSVNPFLNMVVLYMISKDYEKILTDIKWLENEKYDLVLTEFFNSDMHFGLTHKIGAPVIGICAADVYPWMYQMMRNPDDPAYMPVLLSKNPSVMGFSERVMNTLTSIIIKLTYSFIFRPLAQRAAERVFGPLPDLGDIALNTSLILVNSHFSIYGAKPLVPAIIEVGGMHVKSHTKLGKDLQALLDGSKEGVIYFSMGSVIKGNSWDRDKEAAFINAFAKVKQKVIWKRNDRIQDMPKNVHTVPWVPQMALLEHPNVVLFISHCGLLGFQEAVIAGVPLICIPMFGDQHRNIKALSERGAGVELDFHEITEETVSKNIKKVLNDVSFKNSMKKLSKEFKDRPMSPIDTAIYWVEYVIKHNGAPHLKSSAKFLTWYQYYSIDIIVFISAVMCLSSWLFIRTLRTLFRKCFSKKTGNKQKKQ